jgi:hypothetical protein
MKLGRKDYTISVKTGTDANKAKFKKECVQGEIYHATDTGFFYIAEVTAGASDATLSKFGSVFDSSLTFPTIQVFNTEADFISNTDAPNYTIIHAKDTNSLYVWVGSFWRVFQSN